MEEFFIKPTEFIKKKYFNLINESNNMLRMCILLDSASCGNVNKKINSQTIEGCNPND